MELLDVYDSQGNKTGRIVERGKRDETFCWKYQGCRR